MLAEAGTGVGKTLGYLAPASLWAEANGPAVWVSTYTRALQRQIERESHAVYPDPATRARKAVVRKGRENYLCLLNLQESVNASQLGGGDLVGLALVSRWARASRDGDMTGGDFPAWLPTLFAVGPVAQASAANLVDRRGECIHAGCPHYRVCFIERAIRASRRADLVIANHALVMTQAAYDGARTARGQPADVESAHLKRIVFDEGHHLFDAADSAFAACLSGAEAAEMRRWIRGPEGRGRRGRGLEARLSELVAEREPAREALSQAVRAAAALPGEGWSGRIAPPGGEVSPIGPIEAFLVAVLEQLRPAPSARSSAWSARRGRRWSWCARPRRWPRGRWRRSRRRWWRWRATWPTRSTRTRDTLTTSDRARIEGALRGLDRRARMMLPAWRSMLKALEEDAEDDPDFVDWFDANFMYGRVVDAACRRHWVDPSEPLAAAVLAPAHGVLVTSATLADSDARRPVRAGRDAHRLGALPRPAEDAAPRLAVRLRRERPRHRGHRRGARRRRARWPRRCASCSWRPAAARSASSPPSAGCAPSTSGSPRRSPTAAWRSTPSTSTRWRPARWSTSSAPRRTPACSAPTRSATASTCRAARCGCWCSTASPGRAPTSCTRRAAAASAARATTTRSPAPASPRRSAA